MKCSECIARHGESCRAGSNPYPLRVGELGCCWNMATVLKNLREQESKSHGTRADKMRHMTDEELAREVYALRLDAIRTAGMTDTEIETPEEVLQYLLESAEVD